MEALILIVIGVVVIYIFSNTKTAHQAEVADLCSPILNNWVTSKNGKLESIMHAQYKDENISIKQNSRIFVGQFDRFEGESCGFYIEISGGEVVVEKIYFPNGITSWHKQLFQQAKIANKKLFDLLNDAEEAHHVKYPSWRDTK